MKSCPFPPLPMIKSNNNYVLVNILSSQHLNVAYLFLCMKQLKMPSLS